MTDESYRHDAEHMSWGSIYLKFKHRQNKWMGMEVHGSGYLGVGGGKQCGADRGEASGNWLGVLERFYILIWVVVIQVSLCKSPPSCMLKIGVLKRFFFSLKTK